MIIYVAQIILINHEYCYSHDVRRLWNRDGKWFRGSVDHWRVEVKIYYGRVEKKWKSESNKWSPVICYTKLYVDKGMFSI